MLIKFFPIGKGAGLGPTGYLVAERALTYDGNRDPLPEVLRGNPERTEALIDASGHQWTYRAGVISFADNDDPIELEVEVDCHLDALALNMFFWAPSVGFRKTG